ncbi:hypothetical protein [uncultured Rhodospira sp.]|uniref:hypothetical protein n=1 Tax=uncultured Rhodospira sp. TaxID=1936189 RepID=UPI0026359D31|nr:hypothetical protein [uncultured Rhodospira sp.]
MNISTNPVAAARAFASPAATTDSPRRCPGQEPTSCAVSSAVAGTVADSRAALMEANARLLDSLEEEAMANLLPIITEAKAQLAREIEHEREWETAKDRDRDERFE